MKITILLFFTVCLFSSCNNPATDEPWTAERAWRWYKNHPWIVGFNYVPSTACNTTEFWSKETFDPQTIDRELGWAAELGFNSSRVFIQYIVWKNDPSGFKKRFEIFLKLAHEHRIKVMPVFFDDCAFGEPQQFDPYLGKQRDPIPRMGMPSWTPSPGIKLGNSPEERPMLEKYVRDMISHYRKDRRIIIWDLYNEPVIGRVGTPQLVHDVFRWARMEKPSKPLTIGVWALGDRQPEFREINEAQLMESDIISFHNYSDYTGLRKAIERFKRYGRPVVNTEYMARTFGGQWETQLPLFKEEGVGCYNWGLVNGRTQCQYQLYPRSGRIEPVMWYHDLFHSDGRPYDPLEHEVIRKTTGSKELDWEKHDYSKMISREPDNIRWNSGSPVFAARNDNYFDNLAVKDPSIVFYKGNWHLFYSALSSKDVRESGGLGIGYVKSSSLESLNNAERFLLNFSNEKVKGRPMRFAAPQVFYFEPQKKWYLVFQGYWNDVQPVYSTNDNIEDPNGWTQPKELMAKNEKNPWVDFNVICNNENAYLVYSRDYKSVYCASTSLKDFPEKFDPTKSVELISSPEILFGEAAHVYKVKGKDLYHMIYEKTTTENSITGRRYYSLYFADRITGPWHLKEDKWAGLENLAFEGNEWFDDVSHGEMIRTNYDQTMEYDHENPRMLMQGITAAERAYNGKTIDYFMFPWKLGILEMRNKLQ